MFFRAGLGLPSATERTMPQSPPSFGTSFEWGQLFEFSMNSPSRTEADWVGSFFSNDDFREGNDGDPLVE